MNKEELSEILERHHHWLKEDCEGWEGMRANLVYADLIGANLRGADLIGANLHGANLRGADLRGANLRGADLPGADLREAVLIEADLREADLRGAHLRGANLRRADLIGANLHGANLRGANLRGANLRGADLPGADLREAVLIEADLREADLHGAHLREADLRGAVLIEADLRGAKEVPFVPYACPEFGMFIGFKKARFISDDIEFPVIVMLEIPEDAKRLSATGRKCRCDKAKVLAIQNLDGTDTEIKAAFSCYNRDFMYRVGETVSVDYFDEDRWNECSTGIHFFITREEAIRY